MEIICKIFLIKQGLIFKTFNRGYSETPPLYILIILSVIKKTSTINEINKREQLPEKIILIKKRKRTVIIYIVFIYSCFQNL